MAEQVQIDGKAGARPDVRVLRLTGQLNLVTVPGFLEALRKETAQGVILDFSKVTMLDSAGVGSLIQTLTTFQKAGRKLALAGLSERARSVLELTRVARIFTIFGSAEEAETKL